jgi:hypothetical protein
MPQQQKTYLVICEGASETAYFQKLNRYLRESQINLTLLPKCCKGGQYSIVVQKYKQVFKGNKNSLILIWVDYDMYCRNDQGNQDSYNNKPSGIPDFLFSRMNFENYLALHMEKEQLDKWILQCVSHNHFQEPMHAAVYEDIFRETMFKGYKKGDMPFSITQDHLDRLFKTNKDPRIPISCDFATKLQSLLDR